MTVEADPICPHCGAPDIIYTVDGHAVCPDCAYQDGYVQCAHCRDYVPEADCTKDDEDEWICMECACTHANNEEVTA